MQHTQSIDQRVHVIVAEQLCKAADQVTDAANLREDLDADSLDIFELGMELEDAFGVELIDGEVADAKTVGDLVALVRGQTTTFQVEGQVYTLAQMLAANADDPDLCTWAGAARPGDVYPALVACACVARG